MPVMNFDLEDGLPPVSFTLKAADAERFMDFMAECQRIRDSACESEIPATGVGALVKATERFINAKGRYHTEQNYRALVAAFDEVRV